MNWCTINGDKVKLEKELENFVNIENIIIHVGTDAQRVSSTESDFVTVVCVHAVDLGINRNTVSRIFYWKDKRVKTHNLWAKLYGETERSLRIAVKLTEVFGQEMADRILVHVDANPNPLYQSSNYVKQLAGMVIGYGFKHILKPDAWASSHAADHIVKHKNERPHL